jgi:endonuclease/exonuclease/phosphatase family metal-dependent hydrolase
MYRIKIICLILFTLVSANTLKAQTIIAGTYNLRLETTSDVGNLWKDRNQHVAALIRFHDFDILGTQEAFKNQIDDLLKALPEYSVYGKGRDDGEHEGEHSAIFYNTDKFTLLDKGDFWLSQTPNKPTLGWDATCCKRICSWVYLRVKKTKQTFYVFNAHYDHQGKVARKQSSLLIVEKIKEIAQNKPVIFMGDLNGNHDSEPYQIITNSTLLKDTYSMVKYPYAPSNSFNGFGSGLKGEVSIIDHVFVSKDFEVKKWGELTDNYQGKYPSDHYPILTEITLKK